MPKAQAAIIRRYTRRDAARYLTERLGRSVSHRTMPKLTLPYQLILGQASYRQDDLDAYIDGLLRAPRRMGRAPRHPVARVDATT
jgi:hypothetical protein